MSTKELSEFINWFYKNYGEDGKALKGRCARDVHTEFTFIPQENPIYVLICKSIEWDEYGNYESWYILYVFQNKKPILEYKMYQEEGCHGWLGKELKYLPSNNLLESFLLELTEYDEKEIYGEGNHDTGDPGQLIDVKRIEEVKNIYLQNGEAEIFLQKQLELILPNVLTSLIIHYTFEVNYSVVSKEINANIPIWKTNNKGIHNTHKAPSVPKISKASPEPRASSRQSILLSP